LAVSRFSEEVGLEQQVKKTVRSCAVCDSIDFTLLDAASL
jgi:hypothetical protein